MYVFCVGMGGRQEPEIQDIFKTMILKAISKISILMVSNHPLRKTIWGQSKRQPLQV